MSSTPLSDAHQSARGRGHEAYRGGNYEVAEAAFQEALVNEPDDSRLWLALARTQRRLESFDQSYASASKALDLRPEWPAAIWHAGNLLLREKRNPDVIRLLDRLGSMEGMDTESLRKVAKLAVRVRHALVAQRAGLELLERDKRDSDGTLAVALAEWDLGRREEASAIIDQFEAEGTDVAFEVTARFFLAADDPRRAAANLRRLAGADADLLTAVGRSLAERGELREALDLFQRAVDRAPGHERAARWRARIAGELSVLTNEWSPSLPGPAPVQPVPHRILHVVGRSLPHVQTGYSLRTQAVASSQKFAGFDPHIVTSLGFPWNHGFSDAPERDLVNGITYHRLRSLEVPGPLDERLTHTVSAAVDLAYRVRPAVVHAASDFQNALVGIQVGRALGVPVVYEVRGFWEESWLAGREATARDSDRFVGRRNLELRCMLGADRIVTLSDGMKKHIVALGVPENKITIVPNAVDVNVFHPVAPDRTLATELGLEPGAPLLGYVSTFFEFEGIRHLIAAVAELLGRGRCVQALLVGDGPVRPMLEALARELGVDRHVTFTGKVPHREILSYYSLIDVFVVPRTKDSVSQLVTPLKPLEAMATARALVASDVAALRDTVIEGVTGLLFKPEDARDLADVVEPLLEDPERRAELGDAARRWVSLHRNWRSNGERYSRLYEELVAV
jgi:PEP-CTERM/exosortase A-associated glycosyltransferase